MSQPPTGLTEALLNTPPVVKDTPPCPACPGMKQAMTQGIVHRTTLVKKRPGFRDRTVQVYGLNNRSELGGDDPVGNGMVMLFCPFCGGSLGVHADILSLLRRNNPVN